MGHTITLTISGGRVMHPRVKCTEPPEADCRLVSDCGCEAWTIERDERGPFHMVETYEEPPGEDGQVRHDMVPGQGTCNVQDWIENSDESEEEATDEVDVVIPFEPKWAGDFYQWEPLVKVVEATPPNRTGYGVKDGRTTWASSSGGGFVDPAPGA